MASTATVVAPELFEDPALREIYRALVDGGDAASIEENLSPVSVARVLELRRASAEITDAESIFIGTMASIRIRQLQQRMRAIEFEFRRTLTDEQQLELVTEQASIAKELNKLGSSPGVRHKGAMWHVPRRKRGPETTDR